MLAPYCHNLNQSLWQRSNLGAGITSHTAINRTLRQRSYGEDLSIQLLVIPIWQLNAGTILPQSWSKSMTEIKSRCWHHQSYCHRSNPMTKIVNGEDQIKGWHPTAIDQNPTARVQEIKLLAPYYQICDADIIIRESTSTNTIHQSQSIKVNRTSD